MLGFSGPLGSVPALRDMEGFEVLEVLVAKNLEENTVSVPWCAAAHEFSIRSSQRIEDGVVELLVVGDKIELISVDYMQGWSSDGFRVIWESFDGAAICEVDLGSLRLENYA